MVFLILILSAGTVGAGEIYQWVDDKGGVHFSDSPPPPGTSFDVRTFPTPRQRARATVARPDTAPPSPATQRPDSKPAHLVLRDQVSVDMRSGGMAFSGRVENDGQETASRVAVTIVVVEIDKERICLEDVIDVTPPTIPPGQSGAYNKVFYSGCFQKAHRTDLRVRWR